MTCVRMPTGHPSWATGPCSAAQGIAGAMYIVDQLHIKHFPLLHNSHKACQDTGAFLELSRLVTSQRKSFYRPCPAHDSFLFQLFCCGSSILRRLCLYVTFEAEHVAYSQCHSFISSFSVDHSGLKSFFYAPGLQSSRFY